MMPVPSSCHRGLSRHRKLAALLVLLAPLQAPAAEPGSGQREQVLQWLERMALAVEQLNYLGSFIYQQGDDVRLLRIVHQRDHNGVRERIYADGDTGVEVRRQNNLVEARAGDANVEPVFSYSRFTRMPASHLLRGQEHYHFKVGRTGEVAGFLSQEVSIMPRDNLRYGYEYWLEQRTGMLLKQLLLAPDGKVLEKLVFTNIEIGPGESDEALAGQAADLRQPEQSQSPGAVSQEDRRPDAGLSWACMNPPRGFSLVTYKRTVDSNYGQLDHLLYSDGLAQISVYLQHSDQMQADKELPAGRYGIMNIYRRTVDDITITAMGAAPYRTLRMIGGSMARIAESGKRR